MLSRFLLGALLGVVQGAAATFVARGRRTCFACCGHAALRGGVVQVSGAGSELMFWWMMLAVPHACNASMCLLPHSSVNPP